MTLFLLGYLVEAWWALLLAAVAIALIVIAFLRLNLPAYAGHAAHAAAALCALTTLWARLTP